jgi:hypothetical protein
MSGSKSGGLCQVEVEVFNKFKLAPMGVLAHGSAHA